MERKKQILATSKHICDPFNYQEILDYIMKMLRNWQEQLGGVSFGKILYIFINDLWNEKLISTKIDLYNEFLYLQESQLDKTTTRLDTCLLCFEDFLSDKDFYSLNCEHRFCNQCYGDYVRIQLQELGQQAILKNCPQAGCKEILDYATFEKYLTKEQHKKYQNFIVESAINSQFFSKCTSANCEIIMKSFGMKYNLKEFQMNFKCTCGCFYCNMCLDDAHIPLSCDKLKEWKNLMAGSSSEELNNSWISINTKQCPKCKKQFQKEKDTCNKMICSGCNTMFCYFCLKIINGYDHFQQCVQWDHQENQDKKTMTEDEKKLMKYNFYYDRYIVYKNSIDKAKQKKEAKLKEFDIFLKLGCNVKEIYSRLELYQQCLDLVVEARYTMAYSFPIGFYLGESDDKPLYEFQIGELSVYLEKLIDKINEKNLIEFISGDIFLGMEFNLFMLEILQLKTTIENYFNNLITSFLQLFQHVTMNKPIQAKTEQNKKDDNTEEQLLEQIPQLWKLQSTDSQIYDDYVYQYDEDENQDQEYFEDDENQ